MLLLQADPAQQFGGIGLDGLFLDAGHAQRQRDIVERAQMLEQTKLLEDDADMPAQLRAPNPIQRLHVMAEQGDTPLGRPVGQIHQTQHGRFAGTARVRSGNESCPVPG